MAEKGPPEDLFYDIVGFEDLQSAYNIEVAGQFILQVSSCGDTHSHFLFRISSG